MIGVAGVVRRPRAGRAGRGALSVLIAVSMGLVLAPGSSAAGPYEPNNSVLEATGPLFAGQTYSAEIDAPGDRDFFYFYVTSPRPQPVTLTLRNLGGTASTAVNAAIVDSSASTVDAFAYYLAPGTEAVATVALEPQKYFIEVGPTVSNAGTTAYSLTPGSGSGTFGPYTQISSRCATAQAAVKSRQRAVQRAQARLQRATSRLRLSRYGSRNEHRAAGANYRAAKANATARKNELRAAVRSEKPWCSIAQ